MPRQTYRTDLSRHTVLDRLEAPNTFVSARRFDLSACVSAIIAEPPPNRINITRAITAHVRLIGSEDLVTRVIRNLRSNALRHANSRVLITVRADDGQSIPVSDRERMFTFAGHAFIHSPCRGHYDLGADARTDHLRCAAALDELASMI